MLRLRAALPPRLLTYLPDRLPITRLELRCRYWNVAPSTLSNFPNANDICPPTYRPTSLRAHLPADQPTYSLTLPASLPATARIYAPPYLPVNPISLCAPRKPRSPSAVVNNANRNFWEILEFEFWRKYCNPQSLCYLN